MSHLDWMDDAACKGMDVNLFFREEHLDSRYRDQRPDKHSSRIAKKVCGECPVAARCLEYGLNDRFGVFGGKSEREREKIRRARRAAA